MTLLIYLVNDLKFFLIFSCLAAAGLSCGAQDLRCVMWALSLLTWSVVVAQGLSCSAYGILAPRPGIERVSPAFAGRWVTTGPSRK